MLRRLVLSFGLFLTIEPLYGQYDIRFIEKNGLKWIVPGGAIDEFGINPVNWNGENECKETIDFLSQSEALKRCKEQAPTCDKATEASLVRTGRRLAFGDKFKNTGIPSDKSRVDWDIQPNQIGMLDPALLFDYASQLGIDPDNSVVSFIDGKNLARNVKYSEPVIFRTYEQGRDGGNSWFFENMLDIVTTEEASEVYLLPPTKSAKAIQFGSKILNCELFKYPSEHVYVSFDYTVAGLRPVSSSHGDEVFKAYLALKEISFNESVSEIDKAIRYGYEIAANLSETTRDTLGVKFLVDKLFHSRGGKVSLRQYADADQLRQSLQVAASYDEENSFLRLVPRKIGGR